MSANKNVSTDAPVEPPKPRRSFKRRLLRVAIVVFALLLIARIAVPLALPAALSAWAEGQGLEAGYEELDLSLLTGEVELWHLTLNEPGKSGAGQELVHVEYVTLDLDMASLLTLRPRIARVEADGIDLCIERDEAGELRWARSDDSAEPEAEEPDDVEPAEPAEGPLDLVLPFELAALRVQEVRVDYLDRSVEPPLATQLELSVRVSDLGSLVRPARAEVRFSASEILDALSITLLQSGDAKQLQVELDVDVDGLHPRAVAQVLAPLGLVPRANTIDFDLGAELEVHAGTEEQPETTLGFALRGTEARVDSETPFSIAAITGELAMGSHPAPYVRIGEVRTTGVRGEATRLSNGALLALGLEFGEAPESEAAPEPDELADESAASAPSDLVLESFVIDDVALVFHDRAIEPATDLALELRELKLSNLALGPNSAGAVAKLSAELSLPDIADSLTLSGELVVPAPDGRVNLALAADGIRLARLEPYLTAAGLRSTYEAGRFACRIDAELSNTDRGLEDASFAIRELALSDGDAVLFALERMGVDGVVVTEGRVVLADVELAGLNLPVHRNEAGELQLLGLDVLVAAPEPEAESDPEVDEAGAPTAATPKTPVVAANDSPATVFELKHLVWRDTSLRFTDASVTPASEIALDDLLLELEGVLLGDSEEADLAPPAKLTGSLSVDGLAEELELSGTLDQQREQFELLLGVKLVLDRALVSELKTVELAEADAQPLPIDLDLAATYGRVAAGEPIPAHFALGLGVAGIVDQLKLEGDLVQAGDDVRLDARVRGRGIRRGELQDFLPEGLEVTLEEGQLDVALTAGLETIGEGAQRAWFDLEDFVYADGADELVKFERASVRLSELNAEAARYAIEQLVVEGLVTDVRKVSEERVLVAGFALVTPSEPQASAEAPESEAAPATPVDPDAVAATSSRIDLEALPTVTLERLDVGISRLGYRDQTRADSEPLELALALTNKQPLTLLDRTPDELPPFEFLVRGSAAPILDSIGVDLVVTPYQNSPGLTAELALSGLHGSGLTRVMPQLAETLDASELENGSLTAKWTSSLVWRRRSPLDFDLGSGFGAELQLTDLVYRAQPEGETLLGLKSVDVDVAKLNPATGDVHLRSVEISTPLLHAKQSERGLHVLGLILKPATEAELEESATEEVSAPIPMEAASTPEPKPAGPEFRMDMLVVEGIDVRFVDETVTPVMTVPLERLDVELAGFTTRAFEEERALRFAVNLSAGQVPLPKRASGSFFGGLARAAGNMIGQGDKAKSLDARPLFEELSVNGRMTLYPALKGWAKVELSALELQGFAGAAAQSGVTIGDGVMDAKITVKLQGEDGVEVQSQTDFQHLSLSEPSDGPIGRYLKLSVPLDAVLFILKNDEGEQAIPLNFDVDAAGGLSTAELASAATTTLVKIIADAIASSPLRILGSVTDVAGLTGNEPADLSEDSVRLEFAAADTALPNGTPGRLAKLIELLDDEDELVVVLQHELGTLDVERAAILANPSPADCRNLAQRLRQKKIALEDSREVLAAEARAHYAVGRLDEAEAATEQLRAIDSELGLTEDSLDQLYELLRPGAERRADKRTRATCLEIANRRLELVRAFLIKAGVEAERVDLRGARFVVGEGAANGGVQLIPRR